MAKIGEFYAQIDVHGLGGVQGAFASVRRGLSSLASAATAPISSIGGMLTGLLNPTRLLASGLGALGVGAGIGGLVKLAADAENLATSFEVLLGSTEKAQATLQQLRDFAASTPFSLGGLSEATKTLLGFGFTAEDAVSSIQMLSNVAMGDEAKLQGLALVFGQIRAAGKLTGGDLLQLINAGFNPLEIISKQTGRSMAELREEMSKGNISFEMVANAFQAATSEGGRFYGMNEKMSKTLAGLWSTFKDNVTAALRTVGENIVELLDLKGTLASLSDWAIRLGELLKTAFTAWGPSIRTAMSWIAQIGSAIWGVLAGAFRWIASAVPLILEQIGRIWAVWLPTLRTIGEAVMAAATTIVDVFSGVFTYLWEQTSGIRETIASVFSVISGWLTAAFGWIRDFFTQWRSTFVQLAETTVAIFTAVFEAITTVVTTAMDAIWSVIEWLGSAISSLFGAVFGESTETIQEAINSWLAEVQFFFENWKLYLAIGWEEFKLWCENLWPRIKAFFTNVGILLKWFADNWRDVFVTIWRFGTTVFSNLITNLRNLWDAFWNWVKGGDWEFNWTPLTEGFKSAIKEMPEFVAADVKRTTPALEALEGELAKRREEFYARKQKKAEEAAEAEQKTAKAAAPAAAPTPKAVAPAPAVAAPAAKAAEARISFVALEALAQQMQEEAGKREQEKIAENTEKTADATEKLAGAVEGGALRVRLDSPVPATYS